MCATCRTRTPRRNRIDVEEVLRQLGIEPHDGARLIEVWNKIDRLDPTPRERLRNLAERQPAGRRPVLVSALTGEGIDRLTAEIEARLAARRITLDLVARCGRWRGPELAAPPYRGDGQSVARRRRARDHGARRPGKRRKGARQVQPGRGFVPLTTCVELEGAKCNGGDVENKPRHRSGSVPVHDLRARSRRPDADVSATARPFRRRAASSRCRSRSPSARASSPAKGSMYRFSSLSRAAPTSRSRRCITTASTSPTSPRRS